MAVRTTGELVEGVIDVDSADNLTPFIAAASHLVDQFCTGDSVDEAYATTVIQEIETWLAAHVYTTLAPRAETEKAGSVAAKYQSKVDLGLSTSHYGQMAMLLDWQGGLASHNEQIKNGNAGVSISATWLGQDYADGEGTD